MFDSRENMSTYLAILSKPIWKLHAVKQTAVLLSLGGLCRDRSLISA